MVDTGMSTSEWNDSAYANYTDFTDNDDFGMSNSTVPSYVIASLVLSASSLLLNILSMLAILNAPGRQSAQLRLAGSLTMADAVIAFSVLLHSSIRSWPGGASSKSTSCTLVFSFALNVSAHLVCLFNLVAMGLDQYIAIFKSLRYASIVTKRRTHYLIFFIWILALFGGFSVYFSALHKYTKSNHAINYCEAAVHNDYHPEFLVFGVAALSLFVLSFIYLSVFCEVGRIKRRGGCSKREINMRKTLWTTLLILGTFILLWVPSCIFNITMVIRVVLDPEAVRKSIFLLLQIGQYLYCLMLCNCLADPVIYAIRVRDVQLGYKIMYWKISFAFRKWCLSKGTDSGHIGGSTAWNRRSQQFGYPLLLRQKSQRSQSFQTNDSSSV